MMIGLRDTQRERETAGKQANSTAPNPAQTL
jgi:hypothetical protein